MCKDTAVSEKEPGGSEELPDGGLDVTRKVRVKVGVHLAVLAEATL